MHRAFALMDPMNTAGYARAVFEQRFRIAERLRIIDDQHIAIEPHRDFLQRLDHCVGQTAGVEAIVAGDARALKLAGDAAIGQIETDGELGIAFVDPIAESHPAADRGGGIEAVGVDALVEIDGGAGFMRHLVFRPHHKLIHHQAPAGSPPRHWAFSFSSRRA